MVNGHLFDKTLERIKSSIYDYPIISTNQNIFKKIKIILNKNKIKKHKIVLEPLKKNTAPAILSSTLTKKYQIINLYFFILRSFNRKIQQI